MAIREVFVYLIAIKSLQKLKIFVVKKDNLVVDYLS